MRLFAALLTALFTAAASHPDPRPVLPRPAFASIGGSGITNYVDAATDSAGNLYVTGTTNAPDLPVKNAAQPVAPDARILRTTDRGATWTPIVTPVDVASLVPDPVSPNVLYGISGKALYKSSNGGTTWTVLLRFPEHFNPENALAIDPGNPQRLAVTSLDSTPLRSSDGGATWSASGACPTSYCSGPPIADPTGSGAFIVRASQPYTTLDWGATYRALQPPGPGSSNFLAFDPAHRGWIWSATSSGVLGYFDLSTDFGATWTRKASPPDTFSAIQKLVIDANVMLATTASGLWQSTDGAATWKRLTGSGSTPLVDSMGALVLLGSSCAPSPTLVARVSGFGSYSVAFGANYGAAWTSPQLSNVTGIVAGAGCAVYVSRSNSYIPSDAFVAKFAPDGSLLWSTYLGGADVDTPVGLAIDPRGGVYVAGTTYSPNFPTTRPALGPKGLSETFVTRHSADGKLDFSLLVGGEANNFAAAVAADASGNVYLTGRTNSHQFAVTPGGLASTLDEGAYTGFLVKLGPDASVAYSTYLGSYYVYATAMIVSRRGELILSGLGTVPGFPAPGPNVPAQFVMTLDAVQPRVLTASYLQVSGTTALAQDQAGNVIIAGSAYAANLATTPGAYVAPAAAACRDFPYNPMNADVYVTKLRASDLQLIYTALLRAPCTAQPGKLTLDRDGGPVVAMATGAGLATAAPILGGPTCSYSTAAISKLSADGSRLEYSTFLPSCGLPAVASANDGSVFAALGSGYLTGPADIVRLRPARPAGPVIDAVANTSSADPEAVTSGGLYTLSISGVTLPSVDFTLHPAEPLPTSAGGVEVRFDGVPARIVQTAPGRVIVVAPALGAGRDRSRRESVVDVQLFVDGVASNAVAMPVAASNIGILTTGFLNPAPNGAALDGYILNQDGTINSRDNPATFGSTITLFVTGVGETPRALYPSWIIGPSGLYRDYKPPTPAPLSGFLDSVMQVQVLVPPAGAGDVGNGVKRGGVGFRFSIPERSAIPLDSSAVGFYVK